MEVTRQEIYETVQMSLVIQHLFVRGEIRLLPTNVTSRSLREVGVETGHVSHMRVAGINGATFTGQITADEVATMSKHRHDERINVQNSKWCALFCYCSFVFW